MLKNQIKNLVLIIFFPFAYFMMTFVLTGPSDCCSHVLNNGTRDTRSSNSIVFTYFFKKLLLLWSGLGVGVRSESYFLVGVETECLFGLSLGGDALSIDLIYLSRIT